ncbi:MAG: FtsX-like permease family protein [Spirochaetota bacterium]|nr:FtsX-like permease family protein [Spirochaetota bacterium]
MRLYEFFIGYRYLKAKKSQLFISFNTILSVIIVFIGVFTLIIVISVMNGFQSQIKDKILDVDSHIAVEDLYNTQGMKGIREYKQLMEKVKSIKGILTVNPYIQGQGLFRFVENVSPVVIRGIGGKDYMPLDVQKFIIEGEKEYKGYRDVYIGSEMAFNYNVKIGDMIELIVPKGRLTATTGITPGKGTFRVIGFFKTHYYEFDTGLVIMSLKSAQRLYEIGDVAKGLAIKIDDLYKMDYYASKIQTEIGLEYQTLTAQQRNANFFYALKLEKLIMTIILFLIIISAGFTIMGTMVMVVMEKRKPIGILKSMGAKPISIMVIFVLEGFVIGVMGSLLGVIFGLAASLNIESIIRWIENLINDGMVFIYDLFNLGVFYHVSLVPKNVYYLDTIPTEIKPEFIVTVAILSVFLSTISAIFPAWHASRLRPAEIIRYE